MIAIRNVYVINPRYSRAFGNFYALFSLIGENCTLELQYEIIMTFFSNFMFLVFEWQLERLLESLSREFI
jgi:hypothetical protein